MHCSGVLLLCVMVLLCSANAQNKCCIADQFEARGYETIYSEKGWIHKEMDITHIYFPKMSFDYTKNKYAVQEFIIEKNTSLTSIIDGNEKITYIFSLEKKYCQKIKMDMAPSKNHCIPEEAKYAGSARVGPEQGGLYSDSFAVATQDSGYAVISVIREQCIISYVSTQGKAKGGKFATTLAFTDYTAGIKDPSVFKVPSICQKTEVEINGETVDKVKTMFSWFF